MKQANIFHFTLAYTDSFVVNIEVDIVYVELAYMSRFASAKCGLCNRDVRS